MLSIIGGKNRLTLELCPLSGRLGGGGARRGRRRQQRPHRLIPRSRPRMWI
jgi:hypothetical protein